MVASYVRRVAFSVCCLPLLYTLIRAECQCGYTVGSDLYTDLIETDFQHVKDIATNTDWAPQNYTVDPALARGPYGKNTSTLNVVPNPLKKTKDGLPSESVLGGDAGIQLIVRGGVPANAMIPVAEMSTERTDLWYGSFRAGMKLTGNKGTCGAFFWVCGKMSDVATGVVQIATLATLIRLCDRSTLMTRKKSTWNFSPPNSTQLPTPLISSSNRRNR